MEDRLTLGRAHALCATLDWDPASLAEGPLIDGAPLPPLFHWIYCRDVTPSAALDEDGHEKRGSFLPPIQLSRRMWAGGRIKFEGCLSLGEAVRRKSRVSSVETKMGRSGPFALVTVHHEVRGPRGIISEEQDLVFLERPEKKLRLPPGERPSDPLPWSEELTPGPILLFRFSALTFNAHRIHYDRDYARESEFYPDLVVHGPLTALLLAGLAYRSAGPVAAFSFRATRPLFSGRTITLQGGPAGALRALDDSGALAMSAEAIFQ